MTYPQVTENIRLGRAGRSHLLLGNGFSISCDARFSYKNLYSEASENFQDSLIGVFEHLGTNNFEGVLKLLDDCIDVSEIYNFEDCVNSLTTDRNIVRDSLIIALTETHMSDVNELSDARKRSCGEFLRPYYNVFTTNYDLLLYWVEMANVGLQGNDGFRNDDNLDNANYVVFKERAGSMKSIFFLHGALHIYRENGQLRKHTWCRTGTPLIQGIRQGFEERQYPLFVAEGSSDKKMRQINSDPYLDYCLGKLGRIENNLVIFGLSFGDNDAHLLNAIKGNLKLHDVYVGIYGDMDLECNALTIGKLRAIEEIRRERQQPLSVHFFDSSTTHVWDNIA